MQSFSAATAFSWAKGLLATFAVIGIVAASAVNLMGLETEAEHDADVAAIQTDIGDRFERQDVKLESIDNAVRCLLFDVEPGICRDVEAPQ